MLSFSLFTRNIFTPLILFFHFSRKALFKYHKCKQLRRCCGPRRSSRPGRSRAERKAIPLGRGGQDAEDRHKKKPKSKTKLCSPETGRNAKLQQALLLPQANNRRPHPVGAQRPRRAGRTRGGRNLARVLGLEQKPDPKQTCRLAGA